MDNTNQIPSYEIPKGAEKEPIYRGAQEKDPGLSIEGTREILPAPITDMPTGAPQGPSLPQLSLSTASSVASQPTTSDDSHLIAEDNDVIEKEWIDRAKKIISLTSNDPYAETKEINKLKASYMKKRFNKDMPLADEKAA
jgi:hypothetical protein